MFTKEEILKAATELQITIVPGKDAPRYTPQDKQLLVTEFVITENATESNLPLVDMVMIDEGGKKHYAMITGRILIQVAQAIKNVNLRNHGREQL